MWCKFIHRDGRTTYSEVPGPPFPAIMYGGKPIDPSGKVTQYKFSLRIFSPENKALPEITVEYTEVL